MTTVTVTYPTQDPGGGDAAVVRHVVADLVGVNIRRVSADLGAGTVAITVPKGMDPTEIAKNLLQGADYSYTVD